MLQIHEIYRSLQGESLYAGLPTVFVRTTGCPVRCTYCDTEHAFYGGNRMAIADIVDQVEEYETKHVCVTGGEPLAQAKVADLIQSLIDTQHIVSIETSGVRSIASVPRPCKVVLDVKTPGSGVLEDWLEDNLNHLVAGDELKAVIADQDDFHWFTAWMEQHHQVLPEGVMINLSPVWGAYKLDEMADWILQSGQEFRLNLQLHKVVWPHITKGV